MPIVAKLKRLLQPQFTSANLSVRLRKMKILNGAELAEYIKERQARQVRGLRQAWGVIPRLAIVRTGDNPVTDVYLRLKQQYGDDIDVEVDVYNLNDDELLSKIDDLNKDISVHGIIVQLPLANLEQTDTAIGTVSTDKDVDGLIESSDFTPATAIAIDWLLAGYNVELRDKKIAIIGSGRLVGAPLYKLWQGNGFDITIYDDQTTPDNLAKAVRRADVIVTATGVPGLVTNSMLKPKAVVVDAGTASENGKIVGDLAEDARERDDLTLTPVKGGVGPLTVAALFDNVITAARVAANSKHEILN